MISALDALIVLAIIAGILGQTDAILVMCGIAVLIASLGIIRFKEQENIVYARLHVAGVFDTACIIAMLAMGQYLIALTYFFLTPIVAHSIANARFYRKND